MQYVGILTLAYVFIAFYEILGALVLSYLALPSMGLKPTSFHYSQIREK